MSAASAPGHLSVLVSGRGPLGPWRGEQWHGKSRLIGRGVQEGYGKSNLDGVDQLRVGQRARQGVLRSQRSRGAFHQVDKASGSRIRYEKVAETTGQEVSSDDLELGYELDKGKLVVIDPKESAALRPATTRTIDVTDFVDLSEVDPVFYSRTYWLAPDGEAATRAYRLLATAMDDRSKAGIGMVVMRNKQYLAAIRPRERALALSTMRFADEILARSAVGTIPGGGPKAPAKELRLAEQLIDSLTSPWQPAKYRDTYTKEVQALIKRREKGHEIVVEEAPAATASVTDLMQALEASLEAARRSKGKDVSKAVQQAADNLAEAANGADHQGSGRPGPRRKKAATSKGTR
jgi:DNA end-binding protein Ku